MEASPKLSDEGTEVEEEEEPEPHSYYLDRISNKEGYRSAVYWVSGDAYIGEWHKNLRDGTGMHIYKSGNRYEGQFKAGKREGHGTFWIVDNGFYRRTYRGGWKGNYYHGQGFLYGKNGESYEGKFENGRRQGKGHQLYRDWTAPPDERKFHSYLGEWLDDKRDGLGSLNYVNGNVYQGHFKSDCKEGMGVFYFKDRQSKYEGLWRNDIAQSGTYSRNKVLDKLEIPFVMVQNSQAMRDKFIKLAASRHIQPPYDRTLRRSDPTVCTRKFPLREYIYKDSKIKQP